MSRIFKMKKGDDNIDVVHIARILREDYAKAPWNEALMCPSCKKPDDFGPSHVFPIGSNVCSVCRTSLVPFWSEERMSCYIDKTKNNPGFTFLEAWDKGVLSGWLWGYHVGAEHPVLMRGEKAFYIDIFAADPAFRGLPTTISLTRRIIQAILNDDCLTIERLVDDLRLPVVSALFAKCGLMLLEQPVDTVLTRTHRDAKKVKNILRSIGFQLAGYDETDRDREYWRRPVLTASLALS